MTQMASQIITEDLEALLDALVDGHVEYGFFTGIQIHAPSGNFIFPRKMFTYTTATNSSLS